MAGVCRRITRSGQSSLNRPASVAGSSGIPGDDDATARRPAFATCIETVYAASVDPAKWTLVLSQIRGLCKADSAAMTIQHPAHAPANTGCSRQVDLMRLAL